MMEHDPRCRLHDALVLMTTTGSWVTHLSPPLTTGVVTAMQANIWL